MSIIDLVLLNCKDIELCVKVMPVSKSMLNTGKEILKLIEYENTYFEKCGEDELCECVSNENIVSINFDRYKKVEPFNMCVNCSKKVNTISATGVMKKYKLKKDELEKLPSYKERGINNFTKRYFYEPDMYKYAILKYGMENLYYILNPDKKISAAKQKRLDKIKNLNYTEDSFEYINIIHDFINKPSKCDYRSLLKRLDNYRKFSNVFESLNKDQKNILKYIKYYYVSSNYALYASSQSEEDIYKLFTYCFEYIELLKKFAEKRLQYYIPMQYATINVFFTREISLEEIKDILKSHFQHMNISIPFEI